MKIQLGDVIQDQACTLEYFLHPAGGERGIVIVFPGGAYRHLAPHEAAPIARRSPALPEHNPLITRLMVQVLTPSCTFG